MGLSVRVYSDIKKADSEDEYSFQAYVIDESWEYKIKNLEKDSIYNGTCVDDSISYSYSSHNRFRESLIAMVGRKDLLNSKGRINWDDLTEDIPFYEFIDFADNEGCIDWDTSERIFSDFKEWELKASKFYNEFEFNRYKEWLNVFDLGRDKSVVVFE